MAKMTLLEIVQKVLNSTGGDEVSSITDTIEAAQIAETVEDVYFNLITNNTIPEHKKLLNLTALSSVTYPNYLQLPTTLDKLIEFKYNNDDDGTNPDYVTVTYVEPEEFVRRCNSRDATSADVDIVTDHSGLLLKIKNDKHPSFYTSFDDFYLVCDSFKSSVNATLTAAKSFAYGVETPTFSQTDTFTPDLDANLFPLLLNEVKSWVYLEHKQTPHPKAEQQARRQRVTYQNDRKRIALQDSRPDYGRK